MIKHIKLDTENGNVFFVSDLHDSHGKDFILEPRGFKNADEAREEIIKRWNAKVTNSDIVFNLGDTVVGALDKGYDRFKNLLNVLNYKELYIMPGNHFSGYKQMFDEAYQVGNRMDNFNKLTVSYNGRVIHLLPNYWEVFIDRVFCVLSHYPIASWANISKSSVHFHGHCHGNLRESELGKLLYRNRVLDVGVDVIGSPISFNEAIKIFNTRETISYDHH